MHLADRVRSWQRAALCGVLCLGMNKLAAAQTEATPPTPPSKPASATAHATNTAKAKHSTTTHAAHTQSSTHTSQTSTRASAQSNAKSKTSAHGRKASKQFAKKRGQQAIDSERAQEIQTALIREHYMDGEPSGSWDSATQAAMQRYQADQGWQSKTTPDARALIKLGLGPSHDHLLNPETAMTMTTTTTTTTSATTPAPATADNSKTAVKPAPAQTNLPQQ